MLFLDLFNGLKPFSLYSGAVGALIGLVFWRKLAFSGYILWGLCLLTLTVEVAASGLKQAGVNNHFLYHIYTPLEATLLFFFFLTVLNLKNIGWYLLWGAIVALACYNAWVWQPWQKTMNTNMILVTSPITLGYCLAYFYQKLMGKELKPIDRDPAFWVVLGLLFYTTSTFFIWVVFNHFGHQRNLFFMILSINCTFTILKNLTFAYFIWKQPQQS